MQMYKMATSSPTCRYSCSSPVSLLSSGSSDWVAFTMGKFSHDKCCRLSNVRDNCTDKYRANQEKRGQCYLLGGVHRRQVEP